MSSREVGTKRKFGSRDEHHKKSANKRDSANFSRVAWLGDRDISRRASTSSLSSAASTKEASYQTDASEDEPPVMRDIGLDTETLLEVLALQPHNKDASDHIASPLKLYNNNNGMWGGAGAGKKMPEGKEEEEIVGVLGSGDYGRAIAGKIAQAGYSVLIGSRDPTNPDILDLVRRKTGTRLVTQDEAAGVPGVVVVAVGADHYHRLPLTLLRHKVVVDVANRTSPPHPDEVSMAEELQNLIPQAQVVKAFNVLSAYALENNVQQGAKQVPVASDWAGARRRVLEMTKRMGYSGVDRGQLKAAREIESIPLQLMPSWRRPLVLVGGLWVLHYLLLLFKYQVCESVSEGDDWKGYSLKHLALLNLNRTTAITALWSLTLCYLPGVGAAYLQLAWGTKYKRFPAWLDAWLKMRKQLGLIMLWLAAVHTCLGVAVWSGRYDSLVWEPPTLISAQVKVNSTSFVTMEIPIHNNMMSLQGELFLTFGTLSMFITCLLGVSSLPSVGATLSWREFTFIQSKLGWMALVTGTVHDGLLGWGFSSKDYEACSLPSGAQYALLFPLATIVLKLPLLLPCVDGPLQKIRRGHDRNKSKRIAVHPTINDNTLDMTRRKRKDRGLWHIQSIDFEIPNVIHA